MCGGGGGGELGRLGASRSSQAGLVLRNFGGICKISDVGDAVMVLDLAQI